MTRRPQPLGDLAWRWNPDDLEAAAYLLGILLADSVDIRHDDGIGDTTTITITTPDGAVTALPGDWVARTRDGHWSVIDNPDHNGGRRALHDAQATELARARATIGRLVNLHNSAMAQCRGVIRVAELGHALNNPPEGTTQP